MNEKNKPLCLELEEFENKIFNTVNSIVLQYKLPFFITEPVIKSLHFNFLQAKQSEMLKAKSEFSDTKKEKEE